MAEYTNIGDTIEGEAIECDTRSQRCQGLIKHPLTKKTMRLYVTDRNSHAIVSKAGKEPEDPILKELTKDFHRKEGDKVSGDALSIYIDTKKTVRFEILHGGKEATHRHGLQYANIREHSIATIKTILDNARKRLGLSNNLLKD